MGAVSVLQVASLGMLVCTTWPPWCTGTVEIVTIFKRIWRCLDLGLRIGSVDLPFLPGKTCEDVIICLLESTSKLIRSLEFTNDVNLRQ